MLEGKHLRVQFNISDFRYISKQCLFRAFRNKVMSTKFCKYFYHCLIGNKEEKETDPEFLYWKYQILKYNKMQ